MELTGSVIDAKAREYATSEPLYTVEQEHVELLPETLAGGSFGKRDVEWVVQWYYRRHLGGYPDRERRAAEEAFRENDFGTVLDLLATVGDAGGTAERVERLVTLEGVDVPVASAFLMFMFPDRHVAVGERAWAVLEAADELSDPYPDPLDVEDFQRFDGACRDIEDRFDVDGWTLYRALWRLGDEKAGTE